MRKTLGLAVAVSLSLLALPAAGQDDGANVVEIHCLDLQPNTQTRFEDGFKKHMDWHRKQSDTWNWATWVVATGPDTGQYCTGSFGHKWEDFDNPAVSREADNEDVQKSFLPFVKKHEASYWVNLPAVSRPADEPTPMSSVIFFQIRFGMEDEFTHLIGEFHTAIGKTETPWSYQWYALGSGGVVGSYALVLPRADFASFNPTGQLDQVLEKACGRTATDALLAKWEKVVKGTENHLTRGRPDLSYNPEP